jgi:hypothetical protein
MTAYVKSISKRSEGDDKEKTLPIAHLGSSMVSHGEDFDAQSDYGRCLSSTLMPSPFHCLLAYGSPLIDLDSVWSRGRTPGADPGDIHCPGDF